MRQLKTEMVQKTTKVLQKGIDKRQSIVRIRQHGENRANVIIMSDLKEEKLEMEATVKDYEDKNLGRQAALDSHQESLETWQEELEGLQRSRIAEAGSWGTSKSLIIALLGLQLVLSWVIFFIVTFFNSQ